MTPTNDNAPGPGSLADLRLRHAKLLAEAEPDEFKAGLLLFQAESQAMLAAKIWGEAI